MLFKFCIPHIIRYEIPSGILYRHGTIVWQLEGAIGTRSSSSTIDAVLRYFAALRQRIDAAAIGGRHRRRIFLGSKRCLLKFCHKLRLVTTRFVRENAEIWHFAQVSWAVCVLPRHFRGLPNLAFAYCA